MCRQQLPLSSASNGATQVPGLFSFGSSPLLQIVQCTVVVARALYSGLIIVACVLLGVLVLTAHTHHITKVFIPVALHFRDCPILIVVHDLNLAAPLDADRSNMCLPDLVWVLLKETRLYSSKSAVSGCLVPCSANT